MQTREWTTIDKSTWGPGPWQEEPDKIQWQDEETGLPCLVKRHETGGHLCGYVGVTEGHPWFEKTDMDYMRDPPTALEVHGGVTFGSFCEEGDEAKTICHIPDPGEPDRVWWIGFDCAHSMDVSPGYRSVLTQFRNGLFELINELEQYRTVRYVQDQCRSLAQQLAGAKA